MTRFPCNLQHKYLKALGRVGSWKVKKENVDAALATLKSSCPIPPLTTTSTCISVSIVLGEFNLALSVTLNFLQSHRSFWLILTQAWDSYAHILNTQLKRVRMYCWTLFLTMRNNSLNYAVMGNPLPVLALAHWPRALLMRLAGPCLVSRTPAQAFAFIYFKYYMKYVCDFWRSFRWNVSLITLSSALEVDCIRYTYSMMDMQWISNYSLQ